MLKKEEVLADIDIYGEIDRIAKSKGGEIISDRLRGDVLNCIDEMSHYKELSHTELISICAKLTERIDLLRMFQNAEPNLKMSKKELNEILATEKEEVE